MLPAELWHGFSKWPWKPSVHKTCVDPSAPDSDWWRQRPEAKSKRARATHLEDKADQRSKSQTGPKGQKSQRAKGHQSTEGAPNGQKPAKAQPNAKEQKVNKRAQDQRANKAKAHD